MDEDWIQYGNFDCFYLRRYYPMEYCFAFQYSRYHDSLPSWWMVEFEIELSPDALLDNFTP
jgi:hypothetical protein